MKSARMIYFDGRAMCVDIRSDEFADSAPALHMASLASAIQEVAAVAQEIAAGVSDPQMPSRLHGLLVTIELMGSICSVVAHGIDDAKRGAE